MADSQSEPKLNRYRGLKPFTGGPDARRPAGGKSLSERNFRELVDTQHIPKAHALLQLVYGQALKDIKKGKTATAELFFKVCGLIKKPSNDEEMRRMVQVMFDEAIAEAQRQRAEMAAVAKVGSTAEPPKMIDVGTDE